MIIYKVTNLITNKIYIADYGQDSIAIIDGATLSIAKLTAGVGPLAVAVNPVTNKVYVTKDTDNDVTVIDEIPFRDTRIHAEMESYLNHASTLARPPLVGKAVNRWTPYRTQIEGILNHLNTDQKSWDWAEIVGGARSDSVLWAWNWEGQSQLTTRMVPKMVRLMHASNLHRRNKPCKRMRPVACTFIVVSFRLPARPNQKSSGSASARSPDRPHTRPG